MKIFTRVDEKGRFIGSNYDLTKSGEERISHELSYVATREQFKESLGREMGLDNPDLDVIYKALLNHGLPISDFVRLYREIAKELNTDG